MSKPHPAFVPLPGGEAVTANYHYMGFWGGFKEAGNG
jgi:hypothetical protein